MASQIVGVACCPVVAAGCRNISRLSESLSLIAKEDAGFSVGCCQRLQRKKAARIAAINGCSP
ncbi:hypothetical protein ACLOJK_036614, partial [Asimina triloba]